MTVAPSARTALDTARNLLNRYASPAYTNNPTQDEVREGIALIDAALAAPSEEAVAWRTMESAPKGKEPIWVAAPHWAQAQLIGAHALREHDHWQRNPPTHWMPFNPPAPPAPASLPSQEEREDG